jgi:tRNA A37 threonylcarbamoyladenosine dehydratase
MGATLANHTWVYKPVRTTDDYCYFGPLQIIVAGCGGTGARLIGPLIKIVPPQTQIHLYDADRVETRNLLRQHFIQEDVGKCKAEVLAERYEQPNILHQVPSDYL